MSAVFRAGRTLASGPARSGRQDYGARCRIKLGAMESSSGLHHRSSGSTSLVSEGVPGTVDAIEAKDDAAKASGAARSRHLRPTLYTRRAVYKNDLWVQTAYLIMWVVATFLLAMRLGITRADMRWVNPNDGSKPIYGVMIDAGSTGTRAHVIQYLKYGPPDTYMIRMVKAYYAEVPVGFSASIQEDGDHLSEVRKIIRPLLDLITEIVPEDHIIWTPIFLRATAGLRLVPDQHAQNILNAAYRELRWSKFMARRDWVSIMSGEDEALYGWLSVNFLLGTFAHQLSEKEDKERFAALVDLGGGSVQMAYSVDERQLDEAKDFAALNASMYLHTLDGVPLKGPLYARSFLGYGLYDFQLKLYEHLESSGQLQANPCFYKSAEKSLQVGRLGHEVRTVGTGDFDKCVSEALFVLQVSGHSTGTMDQSAAVPENTDSVTDGSVCEVHGVSHCGVAGGYRPPFSVSRVVAIAYIYDRLHWFVKEDGGSISLQSIRENGAAVCAMTHEAALEAYEDDGESLCQDLAYIYALLRWGLGMEDGAQVEIRKRIGGVVAGWATGALTGLMKSYRIA
ncbi:Ectonucleoside triphosphate diphosphohydrolase 5 [Porphyridium purpureum]|uniref:Ectonucleoside triphosphate diphosphohydrolase 5 n=1 Tax=Porphyridium purpureum TaxID=35688 RepID=A0A5J4YY67_PORPP|nr:Ectonucleoside triphosphate diphosphohydrolase 5 [Porphyridium purpureum]|eukprot:POR2449..scf208_2